MSKFLTIIITLIIIVALVFLLQFRLDVSSSGDSINVRTSSLKQNYLTTGITDPFKGHIDAPVTLIMVGSYTCEYCRAGAVIMDQLYALYPDDLKIVWKDLPESSVAAFDAARAARCAQQQGSFWSYHDSLFARQDNRSEDSYKQIALEQGLLSDEFNRCFDNRHTTDLVDNNTREALNLSIHSVPYFQINDIINFDQLQPLSTFRYSIDNILNAANSQ